MARKKRKNTSNRQPIQDFSNNPFRDLKGLSVCAQNNQCKIPPAPKAPDASLPKDEDLLFLEEMALLRVNSNRAEDETVSRSVDQAPCTEVEPEVPADEDQSLFLKALGQMDRTFQDTIPQEPDPPRASPRRMRELTRGVRRPEAELDLHGLDRNGARAGVRYFLENACHHGLQTVLVITGAGHHSAQGPILRTDIEAFLAEEGRQWAVEWSRAPRRYGGDGALVIFLKSK